MGKSLFEHEHVYLGPYELDKDSLVAALWSHDPAFQRAFGDDFVKPRTAAQIKKHIEEMEKEADETRSLFLFAVRARTDDRLIGFARLDRLEWPHGSANLSLGLGDPIDRGLGYGTEVLNLVLRYAGEELNLFRLSVHVPEYNEGAQRFFKRAGFVEEVRRQTALHRAGRRWDMLHLGLLLAEWKMEP